MHAEVEAPAPAPATALSMFVTSTSREALALAATRAWAEAPQGARPIIVDTGAAMNVMTSLEGVERLGGPASVVPVDAGARPHPPDAHGNFHGALHDIVVVRDFVADLISVSSIVAHGVGASSRQEEGPPTCSSPTTPSSRCG